MDNNDAQEKRGIHIDDVLHDQKKKRIHIDDVLPVLDERSFVLGKDLVLIDDVAGMDLRNSPFQVSFLVISMCRQGEAFFKVGDTECRMAKGDLVTIIGDQLVRESWHSDDFKATMVLMSRSFAQDCVMGLNYMWPYLLYVVRHPVEHLSEEEQAWVWECYTLLRRRVNKPAGRYLREAIIALTRAFYFEICNLLDSHIKPIRNVSHNRSYAIFDQFMRIASQNFKRERSVEWYSNEMCLTPKHLSEVVKTVSGRTAGQWITMLVVIEIKNLLQGSSLSIKEIAQEMNFPNQSFLGKYFKNAEGCSPSEFRKRMS